MLPLLLGLSLAGGDHPWLSPSILGLFGVSAVMLALFVLVESRAAEPLLPINLFRNRIFSVSVVAVFLTAAGMFGTIMYIPLFVQGVIGTSVSYTHLTLPTILRV